MGLECKLGTSGLAFGGRTQLLSLFLALVLDLQSLLNQQLLAIVNFHLALNNLAWVELRLSLRTHNSLLNGCALIQVVQHLFCRLLLGLRLRTGAGWLRLVDSHALFLLGRNCLARVLLRQSPSLGEGARPRLRPQLE